MLEFLSGVVVGAGILYVFAVWSIRRLISKMLAEDATVPQEDLVIRAHVEEHNGIFYFYNNDSNEFLVQGSNIKELIEHLESRRPGTTVRVVRGDEKTIANLRAMAK